MSMNLYDAWEVRVPVHPDDTFNQAKARVQTHADQMNLAVRFRKGKGRREKNVTRYHFWEAHTEADAMALYLAYGDAIKPHKYPV